MPSPSPARSSPDRARRERIAVVAVSARSLAEAARRADLEPVAIDLFGDEDLRAVAAETFVVDGTLDGGPDLDAVLAALSEADAAAPLAGVLLGSGFETRPEAVAAIAARFPLLGADADCLRLVKSPTALARLCARHGIPHPAITTTRPMEEGWLAKTAGAAGGSHVVTVASLECRRQPPLPFSPQAGRRWPAGPDEGPILSVVGNPPSSAPSGHLLPHGGEGDGGRDVPQDERTTVESAGQTDGAVAIAFDAALTFDPADDPISPGTAYFQRRVAGRVMSACALGTADGARVLAVCVQHTDPAADAPFRFGGVAGPVSVSPTVAAEIARAADAIVAASGLRGLFGIDFILGPDGDWWLLEINPRPTAALDVLDRGEPALFALHLAACRGEPVPAWRSPADAAATSLLYAPSDLAAVPVLPAGCSDRSAPGSPIPAGAPVCTLRTAAADAAGAASRVAVLKADLHAALFPCDM